MSRTCFQNYTITSACKSTVYRKQPAEELRKPHGILHLSYEMPLAFTQNTKKAHLISRLHCSALDLFSVADAVVHLLTMVLV